MCGEVRRGALAEINLGAISRNLRAVKRVAGNRPVIAVVKADAYGHGAVEVSKRLADCGAAYLAVAFTGEAVALREAGISSPILVLFDKCDVDAFFDYDLIPVIHDLASARRFSKEAVRRGRSLDVHLKIDTGMGRLGLRTEDVRKEMPAIAKLSRLNIRGLMSHFSDSDVADQSYAGAQLKSFLTIRDEVLAASPGPVLCHMANSAATLFLKEAHLDAVRPGLILYGHSPLQHSASGIRSSEDGKKTKPRLPGVELMPAMTVKTVILSLRRVRSGVPVSYGRTFITRRDSLIAVLPVGYADGYHRALSNNMDVLVKGKRAPVVGRVCMDLIMVDVTEVKGLREKDEVVLLGKQGTAEITASEMAGRAGTIPYEILTSIGSGSRKVYVQSGQV
ncbi:MAG TPA: alanine racemase [Thermodesulfovibrionales bacterium]|nr:alanine racemase [Thermodesulfovibrionales bacterium]